MATEKDEKAWVGSVMEIELIEVLDRMIEENGSDRSKFLRLLIKQEAARRGHLPTGKKTKSGDRIAA